MKEPIATVGTEYFDAQIRLTPEQVSALVVQEMESELSNPQYIPKKTLKALKRVREWYSPQGGMDWKAFIQ